MYRSSQEMAKRRKFKAMEMVTWFRPKRGGKDAREQKDTPSPLRQPQEQRPERETKVEHTSGNVPGKDSGNHPGKTILVETVVFVPYTPDSGLKKLLQKADDDLSATLNRPRIRFVERGGTEVTRDVGKPNPWALDF